MNFSTTKMFKHKYKNHTYWFSEAGLAALCQYSTGLTGFDKLRCADYVIETDDQGNQHFIKNRGFGNLERMIDAQFAEIKEIPNLSMWAFN